MSSSSNRSGPERLAFLAQELREAHEKQKRDCRLLETRYHALRQSTRELERRWDIYCKELEGELGVTHWRGPNSPEPIEQGELEAFPTLRYSKEERQKLSDVRERLQQFSHTGEQPLGSGTWSSNIRSVQAKTPPMNPNPSPYLRTSRSREEFTAFGAQHSRPHPGPLDSHPTHSRSTPAFKRMTSREQISAMYSQPAIAPDLVKNRRPATPEPRCVVPPPPHERRGIRGAQPKPLPATPINEVPPVPPLPNTHIRKQRPNVQGRPKNMILIDVSDQSHVRIYSPEGPHDYSPMECDGRTLQPGAVSLPGRAEEREPTRRRGSFSNLRAKMQKKRKNGSP
ncbi:MAG: hypothetical protein Q9218_003499 [Villophora microphyllina]